MPTRYWCTASTPLKTLLRLVLFIALPLVISAANVRAGTFVAYGPATFTRATSAPQVQTAAFDVTDPASQYELRVANNRISSAIVTLNGAEIFGTKDFNQQVTTLNKAVPLVQHNELSIDLRSAPDESLTVTVVGFDDVPPVIRVSASPAANAAGWNSVDVTVTFNCSDRTSGIQSCPAPVTISAEGGNQVVQGTARDRAGNTASTSYTVNLDKSAPAVQIISPAAGAVLNNRQLSVTGVVADVISSVTAVSCNGTAATLTGSQFTCSAQATAEGDNELRVTATDIAGNSASSVEQVRLVTVPRVTITEPANLAFVNISPITLRGTVTDPTATIQVNGVSGTVTGGTFAVTVPLVEGNNTLTAVARNSFGNAGTGNVQVTLDTTPPHVTINSPPDLFQTSDASISVAGMVNDIVVGTVNDQQAQVTVNGTAAQVANRTYIVSNVLLALGANTIQVVARDRVGNSGTSRITVTRISPTQPLIHSVSGDNQSGAIGTRLTDPLVVLLTDGQGTPVPNKPVVFNVSEGDGLVTGSGGPAASIAVTSDAQGRAQAFYTLGSRAGAGNNKVEATATGFAGTALIVASATGSRATMINVDAGLDQTGGVGQQLPFPFVVVVTDSGYNRLGGVPVTFSVTKGGGSFSNGLKTLTSTTDSDGRAAATLTLGGEPGLANNLVEATFPGNAGPTAAFPSSAKTLGAVADTKITGVVLDNTNTPLAGVTVRLYQAHVASNSNLPIAMVTPVPTDAQGQFVIAPAPVGAFKLVADGSTVPGANHYPTVEYDIVTVAGQDNNVGLPIYLPILDSVNRLCVSETIGGKLTLPSVPGFSLTVAAGSATFPGGARSGCITVTPVHGDKVPMVPGFGQQPRFVVTIQPVGTMFNPPAQVSFPNVDGLRPREVTEMYSYDHDLSTFVAIGTATVSADGSVLSSDPGVGILKAGWHCGGNPNTTGSAATCPDCQKCQGANCAPDPAKAGGGCDDQNKCTENDKCVNGSCTGTPVDVSSWKDDSSLALKVTLPTNLVDKVNSALNSIPGLGSINFTSASAGVSGKIKDCCNPKIGKIPNGYKEGSGSFTLTANVKGIPIFGPPTLSKEFDFTFVIIDVDFEVGIKLDGTLSLSAKGGYREDQCKNESCVFGSLSGTSTVAIKATASAIICTESFWTSRTCVGLTITPAQLSFPLSAALEWNAADCKSGVTGSVGLGKITFSAEFAVGIPGVGSLTYSYDIWGGYTYRFP